jgi:hypothetical protein
MSSLGEGNSKFKHMWADTTVPNTTKKDRLGKFLRQFEEVHQADHAQKQGP